MTSKLMNSVEIPETAFYSIFILCFMHHILIKEKSSWKEVYEGFCGRVSGKIFSRMEKYLSQKMTLYGTWPRRFDERQPLIKDIHWWKSILKERVHTEMKSCDMLDCCQDIASTFLNSICIFKTCITPSRDPHYNIQTCFLKSGPKSFYWVPLQYPTLVYPTIFYSTLDFTPPYFTLPMTLPHLDPRRG